MEKTRKEGSYNIPGYEKQICSLPVTAFIQHGVNILHNPPLCVVAKATPEELRVELKSYV